LLPDVEEALFSPERSLLYFLEGLLLLVLSAPDDEFPLEEVDLFGRSSALLALFDDLPDLSSRPFPGLLNAINFNLALSQREGQS
jgi:hypothetical protein